MNVEIEVVYQVDVSRADEPGGDSTAFVTPAELLDKYPWMREFQTAIEEGVFQMRLMFDLTLIVVHLPLFVGVSAPQVQQ